MYIRVELYVYMSFPLRKDVLRATGSSELVDDFHQLFAESDDVALLDEDDAVEAVADEEDGEGGAGEVQLLDDFLPDGAVDVAAPSGGGGEGVAGLRRELGEVEAGGGGGAVEEENELAAPLLEVAPHEGDVAQRVVRGLLIGGNETEAVIAAAAGGKQGDAPGGRGGGDGGRTAVNRAGIGG